jgi:hypothetical protein
MSKERDGAPLEWRQILTTGGAQMTARAKVPGGWLIMVEHSRGVGIAFYPDASHEWSVAEKA